MVSKLDLIQDHLFLDWRLAFNAPYNPRVSYLNDEAASSSAGSSAAVQEETAAVPAAGLADFPLFPEDPVAAGMPELEPGSPSPPRDIFFPLVKPEKAPGSSPIFSRGFITVKQEYEKKEDSAALERFDQLLAEQKVGTVVECVFKLDDGSQRSYRGEVTLVNPAKPRFVDVLFVDGEVVKNLEVGSDILIVSFPS